MPFGASLSDIIRLNFALFCHLCGIMLTVKVETGRSFGCCEHLVVLPLLSVHLM